VTPYYEDADVTLYLGDCREVTAWLEADVLVTDPPYGVGWSSGAMSRAKAPRVESISGDDDTTARDAALALWGSRPAIVFGSWRQPRPPGVAHRLIWHKRGAPAFSRAPWYPVEEEIYVIGEGWVGEPAQNVISTQEWRSAAGGFVARVGHPTPKPGSLMEPLIIRRPRLYDLGMQHANCGGGCVRAGQGQFARLLDTMPERFAEWERNEQALRDHLGKEVAILRDRTGGELRPLTLREFRERAEARPEQIDLFDIGGCGCFVAEEEPV
jgi:hypothetical protein